MALHPGPTAADRSPRGGAFDFAPRASTRLRLLCFPYAGGSAAIFREWPSAFPHDIHICPARLPGRQMRFCEPSHTRIEPLVASLHEELRDHLDVPIALFGHSMGAVIAFELARLLQQGGHPLRYVGLSGRRAPQRPRDCEVIHALSDDAFAAKLRELEGTPDEILSDPEAMELVQPILRADFELCETYAYRAGAPLNCAVTAFGGVHDAHVREEDLLAWREHTHGVFRLRMFEGSHFFVHQAEAAVRQALLEDLRRVM
jgi:medium-chain acyl-[acyl-carrier-protein] hydrolase